MGSGSTRNGRNPSNNPLGVPAGPARFQKGNRILKLINTIGWKSPWVRKVVQFCCKELGYPVRNIRLARFFLCHNGSFSGGAYLTRQAIYVKISPMLSYPIQLAPQRGLPDLWLLDAMELLVNITAHEIAHLERFARFGCVWMIQGRRDTRSELETEQLARNVLATFRLARPLLLIRWGDSGPGPMRPAVFYRLRCRRCGQTWDLSRRPGKRFCGVCFSVRKEAIAAGEFLDLKKMNE